MPRDYADVLNGKFGDETVAPVTALSFIFGSGVRLLDDFDEQEERGVGVYACVADAGPSEIAQGLMCALTWVLNSLDGVTAIPLLIREPRAEWDAAASAYTPDSYTLEGLGEDTLLTAELKQSSAGFTWALTGTTDLEDVDDLSFELNVPSEDALFIAILQAVARFSVWLGADESDANEG